MAQSNSQLSRETQVDQDQPTDGRRFQITAAIDKKVTIGAKSQLGFLAKFPRSFESDGQSAVLYRPGCFSVELF